MTELDVYQPPAAPAVRAPVTAEMDSWISVCSDVIKVANVICDTPFVPDGLRGSGPAVAAAILAGRELSLGPMTSLANIHVIKGKPALSAVLMRALVLAQGHQWEDVEVSDSRAVIRGKRRGEAEWTTVMFTADQAKKAHIDLGGYPQDKLYARATSRLARRKFADVIAGMPYSAEELEDGDEQHAEAVAPAEAPKPAQRTAQRRQRAPRDAPEPPGAGQQARPERQQAGGEAGGSGAQPPLPGEEHGPAEDASPPDESGYDTPGTVTRPQLTKIAVVFKEMGFTNDERDQRLAAASKVVARELTSGNDLSKNEAKTLIDTLERCGADRRKLIALLAEGQVPDDGA